MKMLISGTVLACLLPLAAAAEKPRALFGVVAEDAPAYPQGGVLVRAVLPGSPAAGIPLSPGDRIYSINGAKINSRAEMKAVLLSLAPGENVAVVFEKCSSGKVAEAAVLVAERPARRLADSPVSPDAAVGGDRHLRPLVVNPAIRQAMREHRRAVALQLAALQTDFVPEQVSDHLQSIRNLARDANPRGRGWMVGQAGEVTLQFKVAGGVLVLHGASNLLTLTVYDAEGNQTHSLPLNTPEQRAAVPQPVMERLQRLR